MPDFPPELERVAGLLHEAIERQFQSQMKRLEEERKEKHAQIENFIISFLEGLVPGIGASVSAATAPALFAQTNGQSRNGRKSFPLRETMKKIIAAAPDDAEIDQPSLYVRLTAEYPALRARPESHLRGQISGVLSKLASDDKVIMLHRRGSGSAPHIYKKTAATAVAA
jgi:hypothetical protein